MKNELFLLGLLLPFSALADTVFYAPSQYMCAPQGEKCVCTQNESSYFPKTYTLPNDCVGHNPFLLTFRGINIPGSSKKSIINPYALPNFPMANYNTPCGKSICIIPIQGTTKAISGNSSNWEWTALGYSCDEYTTTPNAKDCPMITQKQL